MRLDVATYTRLLPVRSAPRGPDAFKGGRKRRALLRPTGAVRAALSGTPQFLHDTTLIVSVATSGDQVCRATHFNARLDTDTTREFLRQLVALP